MFNYDGLHEWFFNVHAQLFDKVFNCLYNEKYELPNNRLTQIMNVLSQGYKIENIDDWLYKIEPVLVMKSGITYSDLDRLPWRQIYAHYEMYAEEVRKENERIKRENLEAEKDKKRAERERRKAERQQKQYKIPNFKK